MSGQWTERDAEQQRSARAAKRERDRSRWARQQTVPSGTVCVEPGCTRSTVWGFDQSDPERPKVILYDPTTGLCKLHNDLAIYRRMRAYDRAS